MGTEFSKLLDLALQKGGSATSLLTSIQNTIRTLYKAENPMASDDIQVSIDSVTGRVRIYRGNQDVTQPDFQLRAESLTREMLVNTIAAPVQSIPAPLPPTVPMPPVPVPSRPMQTQAQPIPVPVPPTNTQTQDVPFGGFKNLLSSVKSHLTKFSISNRVTKTIFWAYHLAILIGIYVVIFSFGNLEFRERLMSIFREQSGVKSALILTSVLIPLMSLLYVVRKRITSDHAALTRFFFTLEIPLITIALTAYFIGISTISHAAVLVGIILMPFLFFQEQRAKDERDNPTEGFEAQEQTKMPGSLVTIARHYAFVTSAYIALIYTFYIPGIVMMIATMFASLFAFGPSAMYGSQSLMTLFFPLFIILIILLMITTSLIPYLVTFLLAKKFIKVDTQQVKFRQLVPLALSFALFVGLVFGSRVLVFKNNLYTNLNTFWTSTDYDERSKIAKEVLENQGEYEKAVQGNGKEDTFYLDNPFYNYYGMPRGFVNLANPMFKYLAGPFLAATDTNQPLSALWHITDSVAPEYGMQRSMSSIGIDTRTYLIDIDDVEPLAKVTLDESYVSYDSRDGEVLYEFELPSDAVVTDLKLGPDLEYQGIIAPRGAADTTYQSQVRIQRDPALLEQTGPRTYRLRVYPIPGRDSTVLQGRSQRVAFTYTTGLGLDGVGLPQFLPTTWTYPRVPESIQFEVEGQVATNTAVKDTHFLDANIAQKAEAFCNRGGGSGRLKSLSTKGVTCANGARLSSLSGKKVAILVHTSHGSDKLLHSKLKEQLKNSGTFLENNQVDLFPYEMFMGKPRSLKPDTLDVAFDLTYYGNLNLGISDQALFRNVSEVTGKGYDAIIAVQKTGYSPTRIESLWKNGNVPLFLIGAEGVLFGGIQYADYLKGNQYFVDTLEDALVHFSAMQGEDRGHGLVVSNVGYMSAQSLQNEITPALNEVDAQEVEVEANFLPEGAVESESQGVSLPLSASQTIRPVEPDVIEEETPAYLQTHDPIANIDALFALLLIKERALTEKGSLQSLSFIDKVHNVAEHYYIVSPYSSYLALVNEQQLAILYQEIQKQNRYDSNIAMRRTFPQPQPSDIFMEDGPIGLDLMGPLRSNSNVLRTPSSGGGFDGFGGSGASRSDIMVRESDLGFEIPTFPVTGMAMVAFIALNVVIIGIVLLAAMKKEMSGKMSA